MTATDRDIAVVAADLHLLAIADSDSIWIDAQDKRGLAAAVADGFDFHHGIGPRQEISTPLEELPLEVGPQAIGQHRDSFKVAQIAELPHLLTRQKLGFIDQDAIDWLPRQLLLHDPLQIILRQKNVGLRLQSDSRPDDSLAEASIEVRDQNHRLHAPLLVVVAGLQEHRRLAGIHRRIVEVKFCHGGKIGMRKKEGSIEWNSGRRGS